MTHTDPDLAKLYAAILRVPEDTSLRLVYADRLDEQPTSVVCPKCAGAGRSRDWVHGGCQGSDGIWRSGYPKCGTCAGSGEAPNPDHDPARAELIRVQVELAGLSRFKSDYPDCPSCGGDGLSDPPPYHRTCAQCLGTGKRDRRIYKHVTTLIGREAALRAANRARWLRVECRECGGYGEYVRGDRCKVCRGTGDAGGLTWRFGPTITEPPAVTLAGGFPAVAEVPRLAGCVREEQHCRVCIESRPLDSGRLDRHDYCARCDARSTGQMAVTRTVPSDWLRAVVTHHPCYPVPLDREPWAATDGSWGWHGAGLPEPILQFAPDSYPTRDLAIAALGLALRAFGKGGGA